MGAPHHRKQGGCRRLLMSTSAIILCIIACSVVTFLGIDARCNYDIETWLPVYPDAEVVSVDYDFLRARGMGETTLVLYTPDDSNTVRTWYTNYRRELTRGEQGANPNRAMGGIAETRRSITDAPDAPGTLITLFSKCADE